jgi:excisionase family DNA binding protein
MATATIPANVAVTKRAAIPPRLLRTAEAARYLGLGAKAIRALIQSGQLPYVQLKPGNSPFLLLRKWATEP